MNLLQIFLVRATSMALLWWFFTMDFFGSYSYINNQLLDFLQSISLFFIKIMDYEAFSEGRHFGIVGSSGVILGSPCDGLSLTYLYSAFIISSNGKPLKKTLWVCAGVFGIELLNLVRINCLVWLTKYHYDWLAFNHDFTFTFGLYSLIFIAWITYAKSNA